MKEDLKSSPEGCHSKCKTMHVLSGVHFSYPGGNSGKVTSFSSLAVGELRGMEAGHQ